MKSLQAFFNYLQTARFLDKETLLSVYGAAMSNPQSFFGQEIPTYNQESDEAADKISKLMEERDPTINITRSYTDTDIPVNSIAYHRVFGSILADDVWRWYFSSKAYMRDLLTADANPNINAHFVHISSGGGEAWLLEKVYETTLSLKKPVYAFIEKCACSAALYIAAPANKIKAYTRNCTIGSIGTMVAFLDILGWYEQMGAKWVEVYATKSDLKNKKYNDLVNEKPDRYIKEELNPLRDQFEAAMREARPGLNNLKEDHPVFRGDTFSAEKLLSEQIDLIDGLADIEEAVAECHEMGIQYKNKKNAQNQALNYI